MDALERQMFSRLHQRISSYECTQDDIYSFLMLIRRYADKNVSSDIPVIEFADFISHRNEDRGKIKEYLEYVKNCVNSIIKNRTDVQPRIGTVFTFEEIKTSFNNILKKLGFLLFSTRMVRVILLFIMSILQNTEILHIVKGGRSSIGYLHFRCSANHFSLVGIVKVIKNKRNISIVFPMLELHPLLNDNILLHEAILFKNTTIFEKSEPESILLDIHNIENKFVISASPVKNT